MGDPELGGAAIGDARVAEAGGKRKTVAVVGMLAVACVASFLVGRATAGSGGDGDGDGDASSGGAAGEAQAQEAALNQLTVSALSRTEPALEYLDPEDIDELVAKFKRGETDWSNSPISRATAEALATLVDASNSGDVTAQIGEFPEDLVNGAWEHQEGVDYSGGVRSEGDRVQVTLEDGTCFISADPSNTAADFRNNQDSDIVDVLSITGEEGEIQDESCGCARRVFFFCREFNTCTVSRSIGRGYSGFVSAYNIMRSDVFALIESRCEDADEFVFVGHSRGGAIAAVFAMAVHADNLIPADKINLVTFGAPRVLTTASSDAVHNEFTQFRIVNADDVVASVPPPWLGIKHFGEMRCRDCDFPEERDQPLVSRSLPDHLAYCRFFGNKSCFTR